MKSTTEDSKQNGNARKTRKSNRAVAGRGSVALSASDNPVVLDFRQSLINSTLRKVLKRLHYSLQVMLTCVRWYVAYPLSLRHIQEMMQERGVFVDHVTVHRWAIKVLPVLNAIFRRR